MRIDASGLYPSRKAGDAANDTGSARESGQAAQHGGDQVSVSSRARLISLARQALDETPAVRREVVDAARQRLEAGDAVGDGQSIAGAIFDSISDEAA